MKNNATIFLIDDDTDDHEIFALALQEVSPSYRCITANDGVHALEKLKSGAVQPDCIFLDLNMPRMDGKQCLKEIKQDLMLNKIPIVMYSTSSEIRDKQQLLAMGASAFVTKAPMIDELVASLRNVFVKLK